MANDMNTMTLVAIDHQAAASKSGAGAGASRAIYAGIDAHGALARTNPRGAAPDLALSARLVPGVGFATVTKNGETVIELRGMDAEGGMTAADAEQIALTEPDKEWRIHLVALLDDRHYRRVSKGRWMLYRSGYGLS